MQTIEVDNDVYRHIQSLAIPFEESEPNDTLKRLFGLKENAANRPGSKIEIKKPDTKHVSVSSCNSSRRKAPKTDLTALILSGAITEGEFLYFIDYSASDLGCAAQVVGNQLIFEGSTYSMSNLAQILLSQHGYKSTSVRGPNHWRKENGETISDLWDKHLKDKKPT